jgi:hypothetical protein
MSSRFVGPAWTMAGGATPDRRPSTYSPMDAERTLDDWHSMFARPVWYYQIPQSGQASHRGEQASGKISGSVIIPVPSTT